MSETRASIPVGLIRVSRLLAMTLAALYNNYFEIRGARLLAGLTITVSVTLYT